MFKYQHILESMAERAKVSDTPWDVVQIRDNGDGKWIDLDGMPEFHHASEYRLKPKTININGHEVPEPLRVPPEFQDVIFAVLLSHGQLFIPSLWHGDNADMRRLEMGILHKTSEAAMDHAKALLSFTEKKE